MTDYILIQNSARKPPPDAIVKQFGQISANIKSHLRQFLRYPNTELWVYRHEAVFRPFLSALLLRLYSRGRCAIVSDVDNRRVEITPGLLLRWGARYGRNRLGISALLRATESEVARLTALLPARRVHLDLSKRALYLRTDLGFGIRSGGSVGHIAGVLNNLDQFTGQKPLFLSTDRIPTTRDDIEKHLILPNGEFSDLGLVQQIDFNRQFVAQAQAYLEKQRPELAFIYQRSGLYNFSGTALALRYNLPFVLEFNGSEIWTTKHWGSGRVPFETLAESIERLNARAADLIVVVSQPIKDQLLEQGITAEKVLVNPNAVNVERYHPGIDGSAVRARYGLEGKRVIGFIGTFGAWHGAEVLAEAFGKLMQKYPAYRDSVRLLMIGDGTKMALVKQHLRTYSVEALTVLTGLVPQEEGAEHLAAADILASPHVPNPDGTPFFGSPTKLFEYMAMGRGIVASDLDQIGQILTHDVTAWKVKPGDSDDLVEGLKVLLDDPARAQRLGEAARQLVVREYTWREHTRKIIEALQAQFAPQTQSTPR
ncbi:MAG: glycosyltransferase family 4 protein [Chloroflexi bacterium]|nr:glycosyltransferase family 4 protein [Chloroflexota bacterium]